MRAERNRCADLLRVCAIGAVVLGHWLLIDVTFRDGRLSGLDALDYVGWARWVTLLLQVMPVFFLVGGFANAVSWQARREQGEDWRSWVQGRAARLLWPTVMYVAVCAFAVVTARIAGADSAVLARAGWLVALHLWFLPVYLLLIALTPLLHAAHRRWGLAVPAVMALGAAGVDALVLGARLPLVGFMNYLLVWGSMHQWGFAWQDGTLTTPRWRCRALAAGGVVLLAALLGWGPFPVDMIGAGTRVGNTSPPSIALLAFAAAQTGLLLMAEPALLRLLARPGLWRRISRFNAAVMTVYLWHMVPVILVALALYPTGLAPQPAIGTAAWLALRLPWVALLSAVMIPLVLVLLRAQRPLLRLPAGVGPTGWWSAPLLVCGLAFCLPALAVLAIGGFAPGGQLAVLPLTLCAVGLVAVVCSGRPRQVPRRTKALGTPSSPPPGRGRPHPGRQTTPPHLPARDFAGRAPVKNRAWADFEETPQLAVVSTETDEPGDWLRAGQAMERVLLTATLHRLSTSFATQPLEWPELRWVLRDPVSGTGHVQMVIRLGYGPTGARTPRRPVEDVLTVED